MEQIEPVKEPEQDVRHHWQLAESSEWYTPGWVVDIFRKTCEGGEILLDPATNPVSNVIVKARTGFTVEHNGLGPKSWWGPLWSNFPYGWVAEDGSEWFKGHDLKRVSGVELWVDRLGYEFDRGDGWEAATLIGSRHLNLDSVQRLINGVHGPTAVLHFDHRIKFLRIPQNKIGTLDNAAQLEEADGPTGNNVLVYVGHNLGKFAWHGKKFGAVHVSVETMWDHRSAYLHMLDQIEELKAKEAKQPSFNSNEVTQ